MIKIIRVGVEAQKDISTLDLFDTELKGMIFMTRLTKYEKETIILTNEEDDFGNVFTYNKGLQRRFMSFAEKYPDNCRFKSQNNEGGMTFEIDKGRMSVRLTAPYSEERRRVSSDYAKKYGLNHTEK
ncbi:MAG: molecular chaperone [Lachnospiraceae bacterium]